MKLQALDMSPLEPPLITISITTVLVQKIVRSYYVCFPSLVYKFSMFERCAFATRSSEGHVESENILSAPVSLLLLLFFPLQLLCSNHSGARDEGHKLDICYWLRPKFIR